jgi:hypothetical protein
LACSDLSKCLRCVNRYRFSRDRLPIDGRYLAAELLRYRAISQVPLATTALSCGEVVSRTPMRRSRSPGSARAAIGQAAAPPSSVMNSRPRCKRKVRGRVEFTNGLHRTGGRFSGNAAPPPPPIPLSALIAMLGLDNISDIDQAAAIVATATRTATTLVLRMLCLVH